MLACTETSRADAGSSQTTSVGLPANARAIAMRCFWPPESSGGRWPRGAGSTRTSAESFSHLGALGAALGAAETAYRAAKDASRHQAGLSVESGFWKTIWMARSASASAVPPTGWQLRRERMVPPSGGEGR